MPRLECVLLLGALLLSALPTPKARAQAPHLDLTLRAPSLGASEGPISFPVDLATLPASERARFRRYRGGRALLVAGATTTAGAAIWLGSLVSARSCNWDDEGPTLEGPEGFPLGATFATAMLTSSFVMTVAGVRRLQVYPRADRRRFDLTRRQRRGITLTGVGVGTVTIMLGAGMGVLEMASRCST